MSSTKHSNGHNSVPIQANNNLPFVRFSSLLTQDQRQPFNIFGVVIGYTKPKEITNPHAHDKYSATYTLTDDTLHNKYFVTLNLFGDSYNQFPIMINCGNILRIYSAKVQVYKSATSGDAMQLVANLRKSDSVVFYEKVDLLTGYQPKLLIDTQQTTSQPVITQPTDISSLTQANMTLETFENKHLFAYANNKDAITHKKAQFIENIKDWLTEYKGEFYDDLSSPFSVSYSARQVKIDRTDMTRVLMLSNWSKKCFYQVSLSDMFPLQLQTDLSAPTSTSSDVPPMSGMKIAHLCNIAQIVHPQYLQQTQTQTQYPPPPPSYQQSAEPLSFDIHHCDLVCMVVGRIHTINNNNDCHELLIWDGSLPTGDITLDSLTTALTTASTTSTAGSGDVTSATAAFHAINQSLHIACCCHTLQLSHIQGASSSSSSSSSSSDAVATISPPSTNMINHVYYYSEALVQQQLQSQSTTQQTKVSITGAVTSLLLSANTSTHVLDHLQPGNALCCDNWISIYLFLNRQYYSIILYICSCHHISMSTSSSSGMWIRLRNLCLDFRATPQPAFNSQRALLVGRVASDTHITVLLPYYRCVCVWGYICMYRIYRCYAMYNIVEYNFFNYK